MLKRKFRGIILCAAAAMALAMGTAHADVAVGINLQTGDTIFSLPGLPASACLADPAPPETCTPAVDYPAELQTVVTGTASFDAADVGSVLYQFSVAGPDGPIVIYSNQADLTAGCSASCTWSFRVPFLLPPNNYTLTVTASEPNTVDPELPGPSATASVEIMVI